MAWNYSSLLLVSLQTSSLPPSTGERTLYRLDGLQLPHQNFLLHHRCHALRSRRRHRASLEKAQADPSPRDVILRSILRDNLDRNSLLATPLRQRVLEPSRLLSDASTTLFEYSRGLRFTCQLPKSNYMELSRIRQEGASHHGYEERQHFNQTAFQLWNNPWINPRW